VKSELYPDLGTSNKQQKRQWKYVASREIAFVVSEISNDMYTLKNMGTGVQEACDLRALIEKLK
jgi:histidyl-tRNA synthetase